MEEIVIEQCGNKTKKLSAVIFEDNDVCIRQISYDFIKVDRTKHISPHIFGYTEDLVEKKN